MRILHVIASLAPRYGGPSVACPALCRELARRGHEVSIYTTNVGRDRLPDVPLDQPVLLREGVEFHYFSGWTYPPGYKFSLSLWRALREAVCRFDVVHIYSVYGFSTLAGAYHCRKYGVPYLLHPHGSLDPYLRRRHRFRKWAYTQLIAQGTFEHAAAILFNSAEEMRLATDWLGLSSQRNYHHRLPVKVVVYVGVEDAWFEGPPPGAGKRFREKFRLLATQPLVVFFGRLNFKKGLDVLAQAFGLIARERENVRLVLAGPENDGYGQNVREWLKKAGVLEKTTFTGLLEGEERVAGLHEAEVFALPSYTENFGQAVAEAMACGVPVVISDRVNIWPEVKEAGAGLVVRCDPEETARALLTLLNNPAAGKEMGRRGRRLVREKMTWKVVGDEMVQVYEELCQRTAMRCRAS